MTRDEVVKLCRYIKAACPAQAFDDYTPDVWAEILPSWLTLDAARSAVIAVKQRQAFVDVSDIIAEAKRARRAIEDQQRLGTYLDSAAYRAQIATADREFLRKLALKTGSGAALKAVPEPDYDPWALQAIEGTKP